MRKVPDPFLIFDLDGTLLDTLADLGASVNAALAELGAPGHPLPAYRDFVGAGVRELVRRALPADRRGAEELARGIALTRAEYARRCLDQTRPYPGVAALLDALARRRVTMAILSNKPHDFTTRLVAALLPPLFAAVVGARPEVPHKPDPTAALAIAAALGRAPAECLFVGDSGIDIDTARNAGMRPIGVAWGFRPAEELRDHGAAAVLDRPEELLALLER